MLEKRHLPRWASITIILLALTAMMAAVIGVIGPVIATQIENLIHQIPFIQREAERLINFALDQRDRLPDQVTEKLTTSCLILVRWLRICCLTRLTLFQVLCRHCSC